MAAFSVGTAEISHIRCSSSSWAFCNAHSICVRLGNTIEFYDEQGTLLKTVAVGTEREAA
jgi:hypothetical protein